MAHLGHTIELPGAQLGQKVTWGTLGANRVGAQSRQKNYLKHSLSQLNTLGAHLGHKVTRGTLKAYLGQIHLGQIHLGHTWGKKIT